jgi:hypothetical protein
MAGGCWGPWGNDGIKGRIDRWHEGYPSGKCCEGDGVHREDEMAMDARTTVRVDGGGIAIELALEDEKGGKIGNAGNGREDGSREKRSDFFVIGHLEKDETNGRKKRKRESRQMGKAWEGERRRSYVDELVNQTKKIRQKPNSYDVVR